MVAGHGRSKGIAADAPEPVALAGWDSHTRVEIESLPARVTGRRHGRRQRSPFAQPCRTPPLGARLRQSLDGRRRPSRQHRRGLRERIGHVLVLEAVATKQALHSRHNRRQDLRHVRGRRGGSLMKPERSCLSALEHAVQHKGVYVHVEIEGPTEALEHRDATAAPDADAVLTRPGAQVSIDGAVQEAGHRSTQVVAPRQVPQRCGRVRTHWRTGTSGSTWSTRCAARSAIRRPPQLGQKPRPWHEYATRRSVRQASHRKRAKPPARKPAAQKRGELVVDKSRQPLAVAQAPRLDAKGLDVFPHDGVKHGVRGVARRVLCDRHAT